MADSEIEVVGGWREQGSTETWPWAFDLTAAIEPGEIVGGATATLTDLLTGASVPASLLGSPAYSSTSPHVIQSVTTLTPGRNYRLAVTVDVGGSKRTSESVKIRVPW